MAAESKHLSTRERIISYLSENQQASAQSLSRAWGLTRADIRYHLSALEADGMIEMVPRAAGRPAGRGRPEQFYRLKTENAPHNLGGLCAAVLSVLAHTADAEAREGLYRQVAGQMAASWQMPANLVHRLNAAAHRLNQNGYRARWEASASGPRFLLRSCPYAAVLNDHPEICQIDRHYLDALTGIKFQQDARLNPVTGRPPACVFSPQRLRD